MRKYSIVAIPPIGRPLQGLYGRVAHTVVTHDGDWIGGIRTIQRRSRYVTTNGSF
jgi:hypothetical protein